MRVRDLLLAGLAPFRRQKLRSLLTTLGVAIGIATLVASVSVGVGVRHIIEDGFKRQEQLREINIYPGQSPVSDDLEGLPPAVLRVEGTMDNARRERLQRHLAREWRENKRPPTLKPLTPKRLNEFAQWDHVAKVEPALEEYGRISFNGQLRDAPFLGVTRDEEKLEPLLLAGRLPSGSRKEIAIHEYPLYQLGVQNDRDLQAVLGKTVTLEFAGTRQRRPELLLALFNADASKLTEIETQLLAKVRDHLPQAVLEMPLSPEEKSLLSQLISRQKPKDPKEKIHKPIREEFTIVGVFRSRTKAEEKENLLPGANAGTGVVMQAEPAMNFFGQTPRRSEEGFHSAIITVDSDDNLKEVCDQLKAEGYNFFAIGIYLQKAKMNALLIGFTMDFVALIALGVAFLGIMNTMFTAVLERTKEIGIMKSVGAKDRQIMAMFLIEGTMIGVIGGGLGLLIGWLVSFPGDNFALKIIREQEPNMPPVKTVFEYPWWLLIGAPLFATLVTTLAGVLPARRAARVEPVVALRHE